MPCATNGSQRAASASRRAFLGAIGAVAIAGCAHRTLGSPDPIVAVAPDWKAGEAWTYGRVDGYTRLDAGSPVTRRITAHASGLRLVDATVSGGVINEAVFADPNALLYGTLSELGPMRGRFDPALRYYDFPLHAGKRWRQSGYRIDEAGFRDFMTLDAWVEGWEAFEAGGRPVRALAIRRELMLGRLPPSFGTVVGHAYRSDTEWYAPELGTFVRFVQRERHQTARWTPAANWFVWQLQASERT